MEGGPRVVTHVDDAHLLDGASLNLLSQLASAGVAVLVATVRSNEVVPDVLSAGWRNRTMLRIDLDDIDRDAFDTLLHLALGAPVEGRTSEVLWSTC